MWLVLAFISAVLLGFYDASKKASLKDNAVLPVLFLNTLFSTLIFLPFLIDNVGGFGWFEVAAGRQVAEAQQLAEIRCCPQAAANLRNSLSFSEFLASRPVLKAHLMTVGKACIVLTSWITGYFGMKHIPLTIVGPINATRPVMVLVGAMIFFGERLNLYQWTGVLLAILSILMMSRSSRKENIDFKNNRWIWCVGAAAVLGACSGLYDKYIMTELDPIFVQSWFNFYQLLFMTVICGIIWYPTRKKSTPFVWRWSIPLISLFVCLADFVYFTALSDPSSMISVVSLVRRSSVIISFACGVIIFGERNLKAKIIDLGLILIGMAFIWLGTR
ncbi:MAG: EamA family transporter [Bacteroidales bacterium]|nr:EamA family transporter [Bacteroidales bacterium]